MEQDNKQDNYPTAVIIPCPRCGEKIATGSPRPNGAVVKRMSIPEAHCNCGFSGPIEWTNDQFAAQLEQAVSVRERQRSFDDKLGNSLGS